MDAKSPPLEPSPEPIRSGQSIYVLLRDRITQWHYPPGFHLSENTLCKEFSVSRIPVREALHSLVTEGFAEKVPNRGCFVKQLNVLETKELFELRIALERYIAETLAARDLSAEWFLRLKKPWQTLLDSPTHLPDVSQFVEADTDFHSELARASENQNFVRIIEDVGERLRFVKLSVEITAERLSATAHEHLAILEAIERKDGAAARERIKSNIEHSSSRVETAISRALFGAYTKGEPRAD